MRRASVSCRVRRETELICEAIAFVMKGIAIKVFAIELLKIW